MSATERSGGHTAKEGDCSTPTG